jgi:proline dehydrogenase
MSVGGDVSEDTLKMADKFRARVDLLCKKAFDNHIPIMIDAEDYAFQAFIDDVVTQMMEKYNKQEVIVYNTLQMYRTDRLGFLEKSYSLSIENNYFAGIKLVRGAYLERERLRAERLGYTSPVWPDKKSTDNAFDQAQEFCIAHIDRISLFSGTHNEISNMHLMNLMKKTGLQKDHPKVYFSQLYGMSDNITFNLARENYNVAKYIPYGPVRKVLPYLIRRADENSAVAGQTCRELDFIKRELRRRKGLI